MGGQSKPEFKKRVEIQKHVALLPWMKATRKES